MTTFPNDIITPPNAPEVPGLVFRHFRGPGDYAGIQQVTYTVQSADRYPWLSSPEAIEREFTHLVNNDPTKDMIIAEINGEIVGHTRGQWSLVKGDGDAYRHWFQALLIPQWRGLGIRRSMIRWMDKRMGEIAQEHPPDSTSTLDTWVPEHVTDLTTLLLDEGFGIVRYFNHMLRSLSDPIFDATLPEGIELRPVLPEHYRAIWDASNEAFRDHYGYREHTEAEYEAWLANDTLFTPHLWQVAWDTASNEIAGQIRTFIDAEENRSFDRRRGHSEFISVRRPYRRQGLARALIAESLRVLKAQDMDESELMVDAENLSGALRLYTDCGYRFDWRTVDFRKPLYSP